MKDTTVAARKGLKYCSGEEMNEDRERDQRVWEVFSSGKCEATDFPAQHTSLQVCHIVASDLVKDTIVAAW